MSNSKKLYDRIATSTKIPNDVTPDEFRSLVKHLGLEIRPAGGSHAVVYDPDHHENHMTVALGHPKHVDPKAIKELKERFFDKEKKKKE